MNRLHPVEAEAAVLGGIILKNNLLGATNLTSGDFSSPAHRVVFDAMLRLSEGRQPIDEISLEHDLSKSLYPGAKTLLEQVGGPAFIASLGLRCPTEDNTLHYASIVKEASRLRELNRAIASASESIESGQSYEDVVSRLGGAVRIEDGTGLREGELRNLASLVSDGSSGLASDIGLERYVPGGIPSDKVTVIYGETGSFKTTVKNHLLFFLAAAGVLCLDVSLEDSAALTVARYASIQNGKPYGDLVALGHDAASLGVSTAPLQYILDGSRLKPDVPTITATAVNAGAKAVFIDYVQLLDGCSGDHERIAEALRNAQLASKEHGIAHIFVSQVKQEVEYRAHLRDKSGRLIGDPRPRINDCLGSSALRTHAKLGIGVFRPWSYCKVPVSSQGPYGMFTEWINNHPGGVEEAMQIYQNTLELIIGKNVLGPANVSWLVYVDPPTGKISRHPWDTWKPKLTLVPDADISPGKVSNSGG